ncbi:MAG: nitroreductase family deazaflavin-dependent oxidoreductase [Cumulibacter sp.]
MRATTWSSPRHARTHRPYVGTPRYVCLEVVERPSASSLIVVSGFGARAQWYRNLRATPECRISSGPLRDQRATARFLPDDEADSVLARYQDNHPKAWERLRGAIEHAVGHSVRGLPTVELSWETTQYGVGQPMCGGERAERTRDTSSHSPTHATRGISNPLVPRVSR